MGEAVDFGEIVDSIRHYLEPSEGMGQPAMIEAESVGPDVLTDLMHEIYKRDYEPEKCAFYMSPYNRNELLNHEDMMVFGMGRGFRGRPIRVHHTIPDNTILFMAPDAVSLGGKVYHPQMIAYAVLED